MIEDVPAWCADVVALGNIRQDGDPSMSAEEGERRYNRYLELVDMATGEEGAEVFQALIAPMQYGHDYGAYQRTIGRLQCFPPAMFGQPFLDAHVRLIQKRPGRAGDLLISVLGGGPTYITAFNSALAAAPAAVRDAEMAFIIQQEQDDEEGWLRDDVGVLRPKLERSDRG